MPMDNLFKSKLPDNLFLSHYELAQNYPEHTPNEWRQYLKDNEHFITSETAAIAEANARRALNSLGKGATTQEVSAIKALLEKSKLINDAQKQQQHVLVTYMPTKQQQMEQMTVTALMKEYEHYRRYHDFTLSLALNGRYDPNTHTEKWFKKYTQGE